MVQLDCKQLRAWFLSEKRDLPWRRTIDPYAIWVSEVMLQQTQVAVVIPYFIRWMERFPTVAHLAEASLDEVIKAWEGLGYYSRARHLHAGAQKILQEFEGKLPSNAEELSTIKGLGPYTIGAILSFAFHQKTAAVDGNVLRVLSRYFGLHDDIAKGPVQNKLRQIAETILPDHEPWVINEALIELGATLCQKKARCHTCPLRNSCLAHRQGITDQLPVKTKGAATEKLFRAVAVIQSGQYFLVKRGEKGAVMSDLYEFPYIEVKEEGISPAAFQKEVFTMFGLKVEVQRELPSVTHGFTRFSARLFPVHFTCKQKREVEGMTWLTKASLNQLAFSSGHRQILQNLS